MTCIFCMFLVDTILIDTVLMFFWLYTNPVHYVTMDVMIVSNFDLGCKKS